MTDMTVRTPWHLWLVGVLGVAWNGYASFDFYMTVTKGAEYLNAYFPPEQVAYFTSMPSWTMIPYGAAVLGGVLASVLLLLRSRWAFHAFAVSALGVAISVAYAYTHNWAVLGGTKGMIMWTVVSVIALFLLWYANMMSKKGVLR